MHQTKTHRTSLGALKVNTKGPKLLLPQHHDGGVMMGGSASDSFGSYKFPKKKGSKKSPLSRTLSIRDSVRDMNAQDTMDAQDKALSDLKDLCLLLQQEGHDKYNDFNELRNLIRHSCNQMKVKYDEGALEIKMLKNTKLL
eukprot:UN29873